MRIFNAGSGREFAAYFYSGSEDTPAVPASCEWRLLCRTNNQVVQDWLETEIEVLTDGTGVVSVRSIIEVAGSLTAIIDSSKRLELRELQVSAARGTDREYSAEPPIQFYVRNMDVCA